MLPSGRAVCLAALLAVAAACSSVSTPPPRVSTGEYVQVFNQVSVQLVGVTRLMGQVSSFMAGQSPPREEFKDTSSMILGELQGQLDKLGSVEPVPQEFEGAHQALKVAIGKYMDAVGLFLPVESADMSFDFVAFNELMQIGGKNYHEAGRLAGEAQ